MPLSATLRNASNTVAATVELVRTGLIREAQPIEVESAVPLEVSGDARVVFAEGLVVNRQRSS
jgi:hypothetical protein